MKSNDQKYIYVRSLLRSSDQFNDFKGQIERINVFKRHFKMIIILKMLYYNSIHAKEYFIEINRAWSFTYYIN